MTAWATHSDFGAGVLWLIVRSDTWHHRKVESLRLVDGPQSLRRVSIDLTVPHDGRLLVSAALPGAIPEVFVPMAMIQKSRLQGFDARFDSSKTLPIAETSLNGEAMCAAIAASWLLDVGRAPNANATEIIRQIVFNSEMAGIDAKVAAFLSSGDWGDLYADTSALNAITISLIENAASNFLLAGLLPTQHMGTHQVLKYQAHWELVGVSEINRLDFEDRVLSSFGWGPAPLEIELNDVGLVPASYHLEVHTPSGLVSEELALLLGGTVVSADKRPTVISHVVLRPSGARSLPNLAVVYLRTSPFGLLAWATFASIFSALFVWSTLLLPSVLETLLLPASRGGAPIFLALIAVLLGFVSRTNENPLSGKVLSPLRFSVALLAVMYFGMAIFIVLGADPVMAKGYWLLCAVFATVLGVLTTGGWLGSRRLVVGL